MLKEIQKYCPKAKKEMTVILCQDCVEFIRSLIPGVSVVDAMSEPQKKDKKNFKDELQAAYDKKEEAPEATLSTCQALRVRMWVQDSYVLNWMRTRLSS